jgi:hypothetical protein
MSKFALMFLAIFFGGIYAALVYNGALAFVVYELVYFLNPGTSSTARWWTAGIPGFRYSLVVVLVMMFLLAKRYREYSEASPWMEMPAFKWMIALLIMYYLAFTFALHIPMHSKFTFEFAKLVVIVFIAYKVINSKVMLDVCLWAYLAGCTYIGYLATSQGRSGGRVEGIGMVDAPDSNDTAAVLAPAAVLLLYFAWQGNKKIKLLAAAMGAFIANGLVLINSRGSFLGVVTSIGVFLVYMIFSRYQKKGQRFSAVMIIVLGLSGALYVTDEIFWDRMSTLTETEDAEKSGSGRVVFWLTTFDMLKDHPLGLGVYGYNLLAPIYMDDKTRGGVEFRSVHSMWFQGLSEVGWLGLGIFIGMLTSLLRYSSKAKKFVVANSDFNAYFKILSMECALLGYLVAGTFINRFRAEILYWMILFLALGIKLYYLQQKKLTEQNMVKKNNEEKSRSE